ncbi:hypothetical protein C8Q76DRAFT_803439 [Earliella scabrosa]|nr:hypothetical protein C8Q76DRAFT_803439 [Earliella scabrosa]
MSMDPSSDEESYAQYCAAMHARATAGIAIDFDSTVKRLRPSKSMASGVSVPETVCPQDVTMEDDEDGEGCTKETGEGGDDDEGRRYGWLPKECGPNDARISFMSDTDPFLFISAREIVLEVADNQHCIEVGMPNSMSEVRSCGADLTQFWARLVNSDLLRKLSGGQLDALRKFVGILQFFATNEGASRDSWNAFRYRYSAQLNMASSLRGGLHRAGGEQLMADVIAWAKDELPMALATPPDLP